MKDLRLVQTRRSTADLIGLSVTVVLALALVLLVVQSTGDDDSRVQTVDTTESSHSASAPPVATTLPVVLPAASAALTLADSATDLSALNLVVQAPENVAQATPLDQDNAAVDPPADPGSLPTDSQVQESDPAASGLEPAEIEPASLQNAPAGNTSAGAVPAATAVPNPQPAATAVPNPQPATSNVQAPAPAATGGTFTHTLTATVPRPTLYTSPGGTPFTPTFNGTALPAVNPTVFGNPLVYRVLAGSPDDQSGWAQIYVPARPNGTKAWVQTSQFRWGSSNRMLQINISTNTVTVFEGNNVLLTTSAVMGKSSSRTPLASGWVEEIMAGPSAAYGTKLISLGIFSDDLSSFGGGVPKIALHGTNNPGLMGQYASNGCIRIRNEIINQVASMLPVGSKVEIVS